MGKILVNYVTVLDWKFKDVTKLWDFIEMTWVKIGETQHVFSTFVNNHDMKVQVFEKWEKINTVKAWRVGSSKFSNVE